MHKEMDHHADTVRFGFWVYLMTDCVLFAAFFATYAVLRHNTFGGPSGHDLFDLPYVLGETALLLTSSFTCGLAMLAMHRQDKRQVMAWLGLTLVLGLSFLSMEVHEFRHLIYDGAGPQRSAFLSSYFSLVGLHGLHIAAGSLWLLVMLAHLATQSITPRLTRKLACFSLFWHFLDLVWIFIFTLVYLMGSL